MKQGSFYISTVGKLLNWSRSQSLWYISTGPGCCADEVLESLGCRYDRERFGCLPQVDPSHADLLIVSGMVSYKSMPHLRRAI